MLKVQRLEISGFKSFVDPVSVEFAGGVTAIVGPNGCGKSNLSDAMTWVLGEQSAKSLRGATMEDVIFNGSEARKPLGMAEATLWLATDPGVAGSEDGRLAISRRVFRGGESQYRVNGKLVRLKDVRDLLMDTGLGLRAYSVIEQGKIGMILSGKPQERRKLIEEAAGITRYKQRKGIAEVKLEEAMANLLRLDDVVAEVERALRSLKRQAGAARRYQEKEVEYRELLEQVLLGRASDLAARRGDLAARLGDASSREAGLAADLHRDEAALAGGRERLEELARAVAQHHQRQAELSAVIEGRQQFLKGSRSSVGELGERAAGSRANAERRSGEIERHAGALEALATRRGEIAGERADAAAAVDEDERRIAEAERAARQVAAEVEALRGDLLTAAGVASGLRNRVHQAQIEQEKGNYRRHHLETELERRTYDLAQAAEQLALAEEKVRTIAAALVSRAAEAERTEAALEQTRRKENEASERKRGLEGEISGTRQRQRMLADLSRAHEQRRAALVAALAAAGVEPAFLAGRARPLAGWERSLDFYLGALADAVLLPAGASARALATALAGRAAASLVEPRGEGHDGADATPSLAAAGSDALALADPAVVLTVGEALGLAPEVAAALPPGFLVRSAADAERLARLHPGAAFLSREGLWVQAGTYHVEGEVATPGALERERELADLAVALPRLDAALAEARAELERLIGERTALARDANRLQGEVAQLRQEKAVAEARQEDAAGRHRRLAGERQTLATEQEEVGRELLRIAERQGLVVDELAAAEARHLELQERFDGAQSGADAAKAAREGLRTESAGRRGRLELLEERLESHDRETARLTAEVEAGRRQVRAWQEEAERLLARGAELTAAIAAAETELQAALESRESAMDEVLVAQERLDLHRQEIRTLEERIQLHRERRDGVREEVENLRVAEARLHQDAAHLAASFAEQFGRALPEPLPETPDREMPLAELEAELARTKDALDRLGPVNVLAVQEHDEQEERHAFLTTQRADVTESVDSLKATIREINEASSERFVATFADVNRTFGEVFTRLFRGGEAEMRLMDEEDLLESGIEIVARPPGKRLQNLMLMSGGEKALTAIALLFALFRAKPSPFCILDEVDAPLDDVNTVRFVDLLRDLQGETQFIVITHNKLTMEVAANLYGVTMQEKGVSKLVAVAMEELQPEARAASA